MAGIGLGSRTKSVNSHNVGNLPLVRRLTARASRISLLSMQIPSIAENLAALHARIAAASRPDQHVTLVAVSKTKPAEAVIEALRYGQSVFGENRVQEAATKFPDLRALYPALDLHLIGPLQTNKAREAVRLFDVIETLDRPKLMDALAVAAEREGRLPRLLVQINIGDEPQKSGIPRVEADGFIRDCRGRFGGMVAGLMAIPPAGQEPLPYFRELVARADQHGLPVRSIGMSGDFEAAIEAGATHVRVGSAIFGTR
jgi:pyridoxal phosphate enzyme (YggS family)